MYRIPTPATGRLLILPRPRGGDWLPCDVREWKRDGLTRVVSALTTSEEQELELQNESDSVRETGLEFDSYPIPDRGVPESKESFERAVNDWAVQIRNGHDVGIHCRQGIGRSGMIAIAILQKLGATLPDAVRVVSTARGMAVPETAEQLDWLREQSKRAIFEKQIA